MSLNPGTPDATYYLDNLYLLDNCIIEEKTNMKDQARDGPLWEKSLVLMKIDFEACLFNHFASKVEN